MSAPLTLDHTSQTCPRCGAAWHQLATCTEHVWPTREEGVTVHTWRECRACDHRWDDWRLDPVEVAALRRQEDERLRRPTA